MNTSVSYAILKYNHSQILGEELNVGILLIFPELKKVEFLFPDSIQRIKKAYPDASTEIIRTYLEHFKKNVKSKAKFLDKYLSNYEDFVTEYLIPVDASSLQFTDFYHALYEGDYEKIALQYYNFFLSTYSKQVDQPRKQDKAITEVCKKLIVSKRPEIEKKLHKDFTISEEKINFTSDLYWQNGTKNLVKGISLDYKEEEAIVNRALLIQNQLNHLEKQITDNNLRIDLLVGKPRNIDHSDAYKYAIGLLEDIKVNKSVVLENEIDTYAEKVAETIV